MCTWPNCGKAFGSKWGLGRHYRIHTGDKPWAATAESRQQKEVAKMREQLMEALQNEHSLLADALAGSGGDAGSATDGSDGSSLMSSGVDAALASLYHSSASGSNGLSVNLSMPAVLALNALSGGDDGSAIACGDGTRAGW
ncbi:hypothetical protein EMIHUDRAFT_251256 [Emiliania huxleyi CCMP1516]|uniref:C2H2-type domain-containing protein n=2 Tax=Emiliania huxleyi TaxID=2903 RepID=A0A0D3KWV3_EMIH1|nr:hypothetical protein EMIHUDRAFT_251256 [Emiliania huxleyi CCMP1516]EOD40238.1 hypothetical protein EMIHUDRAFT_251256 [Emiliania huxleyi CCMP1516]|eukprot:XP_005792667.1 hypothetical protein EMIHUDRAFT_251256 [Emiliania huxleyi CCMP1516]